MSQKNIPGMNATILLLALLTPMVLAAQQPGTTASSPRTVRQQPQPMQPAGKEATYDLANLNHEQFRALPPTALVIYNGQTMSKANYMAQKIKEWGDPQRKIETPGKAPVDPQSLQLEFDRKRASQLTTRNAQVQTEFEKSQQAASHLKESPQYAALTKEANDLRARYRSASAIEKEKIKQRAAEVYKQLVQMEDDTQPLVGSATNQ